MNNELIKDLVSIVCKQIEKKMSDKEADGYIIDKESVLEIMRDLVDVNNK
jgi:hypothetical protein